MKKRLWITLIAASFLSLAAAGRAFSADEAAGLKEMAEGEEAPELQWLWGEVVSVDVGKKEIVIKYPDYDTQQDKQMTVVATDNTVYENVASLVDLKPTDMVSIDYRIDQAGKNIVERLSIEKPMEEGSTQPESGIPQDELIGEEGPSSN